MVEIELWGQDIESRRQISFLPKLMQVACDWGVSLSGVAPYIYALHRRLEVGLDGWGYIFIMWIRIAFECLMFIDNKAELYLSTVNHRYHLHKTTWNHLVPLLDVFYILFIRAHCRAIARLYMPITTEYFILQPIRIKVAAPA